MAESVELKEETIQREQALAENDSEVKILLDKIYLDADREKSYLRFSSSNEYEVLRNEISRRVRHDANVRICEIGAGSGFLALALVESGFRNVSILEPNMKWNSGTGFIAKRAAAHGVRIWNDLDSWYDSDELYDLVITNNCVHHFDNICKVAAEIRCKLTQSGQWLMFDEQIACSADELFSLLRNHAHAEKYGQFEWGYPAFLYVELMRLAGFRLVEVLPNRFENNYVFGNISDTVKFSSIITKVTRMLIALRLTTVVFELERCIDRLVSLAPRGRLFTKPQLLAFTPMSIHAYRAAPPGPPIGNL